MNWKFGGGNPKTVVVSVCLFPLFLRAQHQNNVSSPKNGKGIVLGGKLNATHATRIPGANWRTYMGFSCCASEGRVTSQHYAFLFVFLSPFPNRLLFWCRKGVHLTLVEFGTTLHLFWIFFSTQLSVWGLDLTGHIRTRTQKWQVVEFFFSLVFVCCCFCFFAPRPHFSLGNEILHFEFRHDFFVTLFFAWWTGSDDERRSRNENEWSSIGEGGKENGGSFGATVDEKWNPHSRTALRVGH